MDAIGILIDVLVLRFDKAPLHTFPKIPGLDTEAVTDVTVDVVVIESVADVNMLEKAFACICTVSIFDTPYRLRTIVCVGYK